MNSEFELLEERILRLESQNRFLKWLGLAFAALMMATAAWGQNAKNAVIQAQKIELRDDAGHLRAELAMLNGGAALRFFDQDGEVESLLVGDQFNIFKKKGELQASFASNEVRFEDGHEKVFVVLGAHEEDQKGQLKINDYRHKIYTTITAEDLAKLHADKQQ